MKKQVDLKKTILYIITLNIVQAAVMIVMAFFTLMWDTIILALTERTIVLILLLFSLMSACLTIVNIIPMLQMNEERDSLKNTLAETEKLNRTLRSQRHDFLNQLQVVYSLIELGDHASVNSYIEKIYDDIQRVSSVLKTDHAALNAILQAKVSMCKTRGISIRMEIGSRFTDVQIPVWQLCRVFGNIIDNAITAISDARQKDGEIVVTLQESLKNYSFRISNNGPKIASASRNRIFEPGFTTKQEAGHGMGLTICRELMEEYGGTLVLVDDPEKTVFEGILLRRTMQEEP